MLPRFSLAESRRGEGSCKEDLLRRDGRASFGLESAANK